MASQFALTPERKRKLAEDRRRKAGEEEDYDPKAEEKKAQHVPVKPKGTLTAPKPGVREAIRGGALDVGSQFGLKPERARYFADIATDVADMVPGVGETIGAAATGEALEKGDWRTAALEGGGLALGMVPVVGDIASKGLRKFGREGLAEATTGIRAYHGSPYHFQTFDPARIGTGEGGANAGRGINLTEDVGEAHTYINPSTRFGIGGEPVKAKGPGHVYEVDIGAGREQFVDMDAPLNKQPQDIQDAVREWSDKADRGAERRLSFYLREGRDVEDRLSGLGYKGLTTDRVSGNRQYTVFDPGILNILNPPKGLEVAADAARPAVDATRWPQQVPDNPALVTAKGKDPELFHGVGGGVKLQRPFSEMTSTSVPTSQMTPNRPFNPEEFPIGSTLIPLYGDKTKAGQTLTHINDVELPRPQELQGGGRFMQEHPGSIWASEKSAITDMANRVRRFGDQGPVYGVHTAMGPAGGDFARMTTGPLLDMAQKGQGISPDVVKAFDAQILEATGGRWPGLANAGDEWLASAPGGHRAELAKVMQQSDFQKAGFPDVGSLRKAITEPELMNRPMLTSGMTVGEFDPFGRVIENPARQHGTYNTQIAGDYLGDIGAVPPEVMWSDFMATKPGFQLPHLGRSFMMGGVSQPVTPEWQDRMMTYLQGRRR